MSELEWLRWQALALHHFAGVLSAWAAMVLFDDGAYFWSGICTYAFVYTARMRIPDLPK
jgi:hypothetical protein